jgi:hypothetical protein
MRIYQEFRLMQYSPAFHGEIFWMNFGKYGNGGSGLIPAVNDSMIYKSVLMNEN